MKPLSITKFTMGSFRKILPLAITVSLSVALLYLLSIMINHIVIQNVELNVAPLSNMSVLSGTGEKVSGEKLNKDLSTLKQCKDISGWFVTNLHKVNLQTPSSGNDMFLLLLNNKDMQPIMKAQKLKLTTGRMPQNQGEVILHKKLADNYFLKPGSIIKKGTPGWNIDEDLKLVGIFNGPAIIGLGSVNSELLASGMLSTSVITITEDRNVEAMNLFLEKTFGNTYQVITIDNVRNAINAKNKNINIMMTFVGIIVVIVLSVLLGNICMIQYTQRSKEFELLHALGYTRKYIAGKVFMEIGSPALLGYIAGIIMAITGGWLMNVCLLNEKSLDMPLIITGNMLWVLLVPLLVTISGMMTPLKLIKFRDIT